MRSTKFLDAFIVIIFSGVGGHVRCANAGFDAEYRVKRKHVSLGCNLGIAARFHFVYCLVAIIPGIQLFVPWVIVDAAVAGVALWEEHHWTLIAAWTQHRKHKSFNHIHLKCVKLQIIILVCIVGKPDIYDCTLRLRCTLTCEWCHGCRTDTGWWSDLHSVCCRPRKASHISGKPPQRHCFCTVCPRCTPLLNLLVKTTTFVESLLAVLAWMSTWTNPCFFHPPTITIVIGSG